MSTVGSGSDVIFSHQCTCYSNAEDGGDADGGVECGRCEVQILHVVSSSANRTMRKDKRQQLEEEVPLHEPQRKDHNRQMPRGRQLAVVFGVPEDLMDPVPSSSGGVHQPRTVVLHQDPRGQVGCLDRSYSLTPTVKLDVDLDDEDSMDADEPFVSVLEPGAMKQLSVTGNVPQHLGLSTSSSVVSMPICRICHMPGEDEDGLISPCRCSGSMRFIHSGCLMKWLEILSKKSKRQPSCELCLYQYHRHKKFKVKHWQFPACSIRDKILHVIFVLSLLVMIGAATVTVMCFKHDKGGRVNLDKNQLTKSEVITLVCGVLFFVAFFVAMYVEVKARNTIYKLFLDFLYLNQQWYIDEYDKKADMQPVPV